MAGKLITSYFEYLTDTDDTLRFYLFVALST